MKREKIIELGDPRFRHLDIAYHQITSPPKQEYNGFEKRDRCFIIVPIWHGLIMMSLITITIGAYIIYYVCTNITEDPTYCIVLLMMSIPTLMGDT